MRKRIKQLLTLVPQNREMAKVELSASQKMTDELLQSILADLDAGRTMTYDEIAGKVGCSPEKVRTESRNEPGVIRASKPHRVTDTAYRNLVKRLAA